MPPVPPDIYSQDVDFTALGLKYPDFAKRLKSNRQLDFSDPESVRQLTKALLDRDFGLVIDLPDDRLCPPVPNRFNYIVFVQRLLDSTSGTYNDEHDPGRRVIGLDIGTGASAIYPLLACLQNPAWLFLGTEIDSKSAEYASRNVKQNGLDNRIRIVTMPNNGRIQLPSELGDLPKIDILMTNPPFYSSENELQILADKKSRPPNSACTGAPVEMIYPGGEVAFVDQLIQLSKLSQYRKIQWFSSMFGKLGSVDIIIENLRNVGCTNYAVTEFVQGQKTRRWCVAWSWSGLRPSSVIARGTDAVEKKFLPFPSEFEITVRSSIDVARKNIQESVNNLNGIEWHWNAQESKGVGRSKRGDVWSRKARREMERRAIQQQAMDIDEAPSSGLSHENNTDSPDEPSKTFAFRITISALLNQPPQNTSEVSDIKIHVRWLEGHDSTVFESFCGWLKRKLQ